MAKLDQLSSNVAAATIAEEETIGTLPTTPIWKKLEANSFSDFGAQVSTVARSPFDPSRQEKPGAVVGVDAAAGLQVDVTQEALPDLFQGLVFADLRKKDELSPTAVDGTTDAYTVASGGDAYVAGDLLFASGFDDPVNNGLKLVTGTPTATSITVDDTLVTSATGGTIRRVGFEFASGDAQIDASGTRPVLTTSTKDLTELGLIEGEDVWIGDNAAASQFANTADNGKARALSIETNALTFDRTDQAMATDTGTGKTIRVFFASRVLKNESDTSLITRRTYQIERQLGAPDSANPSQVQAEYGVGSVFGSAQLNIPTEEKITADISFMCQDFEYQDAATGLKSGTRPDLTAEDPYTSIDVKRAKLSLVSATATAPAALVAFGTELSLSIENNLSASKAYGVLGAFEITEGRFSVSGNLAAYFQNIASIQAVRNNEDAALEILLAKSNQGISIDLPLVKLGEGRLELEQDQAIKQPLSFRAAEATSVSEDYDHTIMIGFWDYLPDED